MDSHIPSDSVEINLILNSRQISDLAKNLLKSMLSFDANSRPSAKKVLEDPWIVKGHTLPQQNLVALQSPVDQTKAIGTAINVVNQARGSGNGGLQLAGLKESGTGGHCNSLYLGSATILLTVKI